MNDMLCLREWQWVVLFLGIDLVGTVLHTLGKGFFRAWRRATPPSRETP